MNKHKIKIPIYNINLIVKTKNNIKDFDAYVYLKKGEVFAVFDINRINHGIVVHESVHIVNYIFEYCNISLDLINDETQAYLTQWVFNQLVKILKLE